MKSNATQTTTFKELFSWEHKDLKIVIPRIQREYVQGSDEESDRRDRFLDALGEALSDQVAPMVLDFIYGDISPNTADGQQLVVLTPLDGQQRLTTLFLLHWYAAKVGGIREEDWEFLSQFSYDTRFSARDFCKELVDFMPSWKDDIVAEIKDQYWYHYEWRNDKTIQSMLAMLRVIHEKFYKIPNLWGRLVDEKRITFYFLGLSTWGLTDDLYIKMNSRGKGLTEFEHFKAEFVRAIKESYPEKAVFVIPKLDAVWTDILWPYRDNDNHTIDKAFMRYFRFVSELICYQSESDLNHRYEYTFDAFELIKRLYSLSCPDAVGHLDKLCSYFDCWAGADIASIFKRFFAGDKYETGKVQIYENANALDYFCKCCSVDVFSRKDKLMLYAIMIYQKEAESIPDEVISCRMRIVRNLVWQSSDEIRKDNMGELLLQIDSIIRKGEIPKEETKGFNSHQKKEEWIKKAYRETHPDDVEELCQLEDHFLLKGSIAIMLKNDDENELYLERPELWRKFRHLFDTNEYALIGRLLLTLGDYSQKQKGNYGYQLAHAENHWKELFTVSQHKEGFEKTAQLLWELLEKIDCVDPVARIESLIDTWVNNSETPKTWRYYFVKYCASMYVGESGKYCWSWSEDNSLSWRNDINPYVVCMMRRNRNGGGGYNWNPFHRVLFEDERFKERVTLDNYNAADLVVNGGKLSSYNDHWRFTYKEDAEKLYSVLSAEDPNWISVSGDENSMLSMKYPIKQTADGIDIEDRVELGKKILLEILQAFDVCSTAERSATQEVESSL